MKPRRVLSAIPDRHSCISVTRSKTELWPRAFSLYTACSLRSVATILFISRVKITRRPHGTLERLAWFWLVKTKRFEHQRRWQLYFLVHPPLGTSHGWSVTQHLRACLCISALNCFFRGFSTAVKRNLSALISNGVGPWHRFFS